MEYCYVKVVINRVKIQNAGIDTIINFTFFNFIPDCMYFTYSKLIKQGRPELLEQLVKLQQVILNRRCYISLNC